MKKVLEKKCAQKNTQNKNKNRKKSRSGQIYGPEFTSVWKFFV